MLVMGILIILHSHLFVGARPSNEEKHLAKFCYKEDDENFVSHEKLHLKLGDNNISPCFKLIYKVYRQAAKKRILERLFPKEIFKTPILMQVPGVADTLNIIYYFITINLCNFSYNIVILLYSNYNTFNNLAISSLSFKIPTPPRKRLRKMADFIKLKRLLFAK